MSNKKYIIRIATRSNTSIEEFSKTNNVNQRIKTLETNLKAAKGQIDHSYFPRFDKFKDIPSSDIIFEIYPLSKTYSPSLDQ